MRVDDSFFAQHLVSMHALGRNFQLGQLYDYHTDQILTDEKLLWDAATLQSATQTWGSENVRSFWNTDADFLQNSKKDSLILDNHLMISVLAGIIDQRNGAINYLNDRPNPEETAGTLVCRSKSREEHLNLEMLLYQSVPCLLLEENEKQDLKATHVITGIFYGAEVYCVMTLELDGSGEDDQARTEAEKELSNIGNEFSDILQTTDDFECFKRLLGNKPDTSHLLTRVKCRLYSDLQTEPFLQCSILEAGQHCLDLNNKMIQRQENGNVKAVPIAVQLCPMNLLLNPDVSSYRNIDFCIDCNLVTRWCCIFADLKRIIIRAEIMLNTLNKSINGSTLDSFITTISIYQDFLKTKLSDMVLSYRNSKYEEDWYSELTDEAENHPHFKKVQLEQWLSLKQAELHMLDLMDSKIITGITFLADMKELHQFLTTGASTKKYALVLFVPPMDERTNLMLSAMKKSIKNLDPDEEQPVRAPLNNELWYTIQKKQKVILDKIRELATHVEKNNQLSNQVEFVLTFGEDSKVFGCSYSIYENGKLLKENLFRLQWDPPTDLQISLSDAMRAKNCKNRPPRFKIQWQHENLGYPYQFVAEYRVKESAYPWIQKIIKPGLSSKTQLTIPCTFVKTTEIRIAVDTCIGRSQFSHPVDIEPHSSHVKAAKEKNRLDLGWITLNVESITRNTAELLWTRLPKVPTFLSDFQINYWEFGKTKTCIEIDLISRLDSTCSLINLEPGTTYCVNISIEGRLAGWKKTKVRSETIKFTTLAEGVRFAEELLEKSQKIGKENGIDIYAVPLVKLNGQLKTAERFMFGQPDAKKSVVHRTLLLVGASSSSKVSLINSIVNFIFGVNSEDPFRFQLIGSHQQDQLTVYDFHHDDRFAIQHSLTIVDSPSYCENNDPARNREITELICKFFNDNNSIQEVDMIGFVMDCSEPDLKPLELYIYCSLISIFGDQIKSNMDFLLTYVENEDPTFLWESIVDAGLVTYGPLVYQQQNRKKFFIPFNDSGDLLRTENFKNFFSLFSTSPFLLPKFVSFSKQLLDEQNRLKTTVYQLQRLIKKCMSEVETAREINEQIDKIDWSNNVDVALKYVEWEKFTLPFGERATNCGKCNISCHVNCRFENRSIARCDVMDHSMPEEIRTCRVCKCLWEEHSNDSYKWDCKEHNSTVSSDYIKGECESEIKRSLTPQEVTDLAKLQIPTNDFLEIVVDIFICAQRLGRIALCLNIHPTRQCVDVIENAMDLLFKAFKVHVPEQRHYLERKIKRLMDPHRVVREGLLLDVPDFLKLILPSVGFESDYSDNSSEDTDNEGEMWEEFELVDERLFG